MTTSGMTIYQVSQSGESFWSIAQKHNVDYHELLELNKTTGATDRLPPYSQRTPPYGVQIGDKIYIPTVQEDAKEEKAKDNKASLCLPPANDDELKCDDGSIGATIKCKQCNFYAVSVKCSNTKRGYVHTLSSSSSNPDKIFKVIAGGADHNPGDNFDTITIEFDADTCKKGKPDTVCSVVKTSSGEILKNGQNFKVYAPASSFKDDDFTTFLKNYLIPNNNPQKYSLKSQSCDSNGHPMVNIECYSPVKWEGEISVGYFHEEYKNTYKNVKKQGYWGVEGGLTLENGTEKHTIGSPKGVGKVSRNNDLSKQIFKGVQEFLNKTTPYLSDIKSDYASIKIDWPKLKLKGSVKNTEVKNSADIGLAGNVGIYLEPLIGATFTVDILNILIAAASTAAGNPGFAKLLIKIKKKAAEGIGEGNISARANIAILFTIGGQLYGELAWEFAPPSNNTFKGGIEGKMPITIEGTAELDIDVFWVSAGAGAKAGAKTGFGASLKPGWGSSEGAFIGGSLNFDGITIYYMTYARIGGGALKENIPKSRPKTDRGNEKFESGSKFEWVKPAKWPSDSSGSKAKKISLTKGDL